MKRSEKPEITYKNYSFLKSPVMRKKVRIGWTVTPNIPKDFTTVDSVAMLNGMVEDGVLTESQIAKAAFGQGFGLECNRVVDAAHKAATTEGYNKKAATDKYFTEAFASEAVRNLLTPSEQVDASYRYCKERWLENDQESDDSSWDNSFTINCWEL